MCDFVVFNRTSHALEIRMQVRPLSTAPIGAINPGELLNHKAPCSDQVIRIGGLPIAQQVGAPVRFGFVQGWAELVEGERVTVSLEWP